MPATIACIVNVTKSAELSAEALAGAVLMDQSITAKIMRLANSAYFGRRAKAKTVTECVLVLGFGLVRNLAASASILEAVFPRHAFPGLSWPAFWTHSVATAVATETLHSHITGVSRKDDESAFIAGLLHDVGKMIIAYAMPVEFAHVITHCIDYGTPMFEAEESYTGTNHPLVGKELARAWDFPEGLPDAIGSHHSSKNPAKFADLTNAIRTGNLLAKSVRGNYIVSRKERTSAREILGDAGVDERYTDMIMTQIRDGIERCQDIVAWGRDLPYYAGKAA